MTDKPALSALEKIAWFNLIVFAAALGLYVVCVPLLAWQFHQPLARAAGPSLGLFGICGLWGFGVMFFYDRRRRLKVTFDEREAQIQMRASMIGMFLFWEVLVALCMGVWAVVRYGWDQSTISVDFLPGLVFVGMVVFTVTQSIAILVQYKRSNSDGVV